MALPVPAPTSSISKPGFLCALYLLATLYRNSELSTSAGLTYFLEGVKIWSQGRLTPIMGRAVVVSNKAAPFNRGPRICLGRESLPLAMVVLDLYQN